MNFVKFKYIDQDVYLNLSRVIAFTSGIQKRYTDNASTIDVQVLKVYFDDDAVFLIECSPAKFLDEIAKANISK